MAALRDLPPALFRERIAPQLALRDLTALRCASTWARTMVRAAGGAGERQRGEGSRMAPFPTPALCCAMPEEDAGALGHGERVHCSGVSIEEKAAEGRGERERRERGEDVEESFDRAALPSSSSFLSLCRSLSLPLSLARSQGQLSPPPSRQSANARLPFPFLQDLHRQRAFLCPRPNRSPPLLSPARPSPLVPPLLQKSTRACAAVGSALLPASSPESRAPLHPSQSTSPPSPHPPVVNAHPLGTAAPLPSLAIVHPPAHARHNGRDASVALRQRRRERENKRKRAVGECMHGTHCVHSCTRRRFPPRPARALPLHAACLSVRRRPTGPPCPCVLRCLRLARSLATVALA